MPERKLSLPIVLSEATVGVAAAGEVDVAAGAEWEEEVWIAEEEATGCAEEAAAEEEAGEATAEIEARRLQRLA